MRAGTDRSWAAGRRVGQAPRHVPRLPSRPVSPDSDPDPDVTVPATYIRTLAAAVGDAGHDVVDFLAHEALDARVLAEAERLPADVFGRLYQRAMRLLDDETLGMASGGPTPLGSFRMMCLCVLGCRTLGSVVRRAGDFIEIVRGPRVRPTLAIDAGEAFVGFAPVARAGGLSLHELLGPDALLEMRTSLYFWANLLGWFAGRPLGLRRVEFAWPAPPHGDEWQRLFGVPVSFDAPASRLVLPAHAMALPNVRDEQTLEAFLAETPYRLIVPSFVRPSLRERLRSLLSQSPGEAPPTAQDAADRLGMSVSTLRRRLTEEGTGWQELKDQGRRDAAYRYLADTDLPLGEIAVLLGFDEPSTFFRAFRRWSDTTPARYRRMRTASAGAESGPGSSATEGGDGAMEGAPGGG